MPPKRKLTADAPEEPSASKRLRSRAVPIIEPPTKFDTTTSRRDQLKSSPRKASKASVKAETTVSNYELDDISNVAPDAPAVQRQIPKSRVTRVYGRAGKQKVKATPDSPIPESDSSAHEEPPVVRRQSRRGTGVVEVVVPVAKAPVKRATKRTTATVNGDAFVKTTTPGTEAPLRRTARRTTSATVAETDMVVDEPQPAPKAPTKKAAGREKAAAAVEKYMEVDAPVLKEPSKRATRRTNSTTTAETGIKVATIPKVPRKKAATRTILTATLGTVEETAVDIATPTPNAPTTNAAPERTPSPEVVDTDEDVVIPTPKSSPKRTAKRTTSKAIASSPQNSKVPPESATVAKSFNETFIPRVAEFNEASNVLPVHLHTCFHVQKRAIMRMLQHPTCEAGDSESEESANSVAADQLADLIEGTVGRAEGNSCLLLGPRGSGKSDMINRCLDSLPNKPVILRLSGWVQSTDRHALREIAIQLLQQTGSSLLSEIEKDSTDPAPEINPDEDNPFLDEHNESNAEFGHSTLSLPPSSHLHSLIPALLTLNRPVIVILDAFDLFALHPRQSLLYCLLDTAQNCRASAESRGIAVIGVTSRLDTVQLLEKRVKSRFSGRTIRTAPPNSLDSCLSYVRSSLRPFLSEDISENQAEWNQLWSANVDKFLADGDILNVFKETFSITRELKVINRILTNSVLHLDLGQPYLSHKTLCASAESQRSRPPDLHLGSLSYPAICLLISSVHLDTSGQTNFTFEMLFDIFRDQVRASQSAPVQVNGGSIGMVSCTREVSMSAFEGLISARIFVHISGPSANTSKEFMKYRCVLERSVVKKLVEQSGQINLKKWHNRAN